MTKSKSKRLIKEYNPDISKSSSKLNSLKFYDYAKHQWENWCMIEFIVLTSQISARSLSQQNTLGK